MYAKWAIESYSTFAINLAPEPGGDGLDVCVVLVTTGTGVDEFHVNLAIVCLFLFIMPSKAQRIGPRN
jgi:hypothetical protein